MKIKKCELSNLLNDDCKAYYWVGFILADGNISKSGELKIALSTKDKDHLKKLQKFLKIENIKERTTNNGYDYVSITGMDTEVIEKFCNKFGTGQNKTYNPANIKWIKNENLMLALIAGFIDGDGNIGNQSGGRCDFQLRIKCHKSWLKVLKIFSKTIYKNENFEPVDVRVINSGYALMSITNTVVLKNLKRKILELEIPILKRKWDVIDLNYIGRNEDAAFIKKQVLKMLSEGMKNKEICQTLNIKPARISNIKKRA